jgi:hypothetical protein
MLPTKIKHLLCLLDSSYTTSSNKPPCCQPFPRMLLGLEICVIDTNSNWQRISVSKKHISFFLSQWTSQNQKQKLKKNMD